MSGGIRFHAVAGAGLRKVGFMTADTVLFGSNIDSSFQLLFYLCHYAFTFKRRAFASTLFRILFLTALAYFAVQQVALYFLGHLILYGPVPISLGTCGIPHIPDGNLNSTTLGLSLQHRNILLERAATQFVACTDAGNKITCPGPVGQTISWDVVESEPGYCWFGAKHCYNGSRTISQRATLVPSDLGTIRKSPVSLTVMAECSHVNDSEFIEKLYDPKLNSEFYAFQFGGTPKYSWSNVYENSTFIVYRTENIHADYRLGFETVNLRPDIYKLTPPLFLSDNLDNPFLTDNTTAPSTLYLVFNRLYGIGSYFPNSDPFFLTVKKPDVGSAYSAGKIASTMACRDRYELKIEPQNGSLNGTWLATGQFSYVTEMFRNYTGKDTDMSVDMLLFVGAFSPSAFTIVFTQLTGNILNARKTLDHNIQYGDPRNLTTHTEVTRWFGIAMLTALNMAQFYTSGTDNNWGYGIVDFNNSAWFCDKTLRINPRYVSLYVRTLVLIISTIVAVGLFAYFLDWLILRIAKLFLESSTAKQIDGTIKLKNLHSFLQLHRIGVEKTSDQRFLKTWGTIPVFEGPGSGMAPKYNVEIHDVEESATLENKYKNQVDDGLMIQNEESNGSRATS